MEKTYQIPQREEKGFKGRNKIMASPTDCYLSLGEWDFSVLSYAIHNCHDFPNEDYEDLRECVKKLNDMRSDCLCHEQRAQIAFDKYIRILHTSMECYKRLIAEKEVYMKYVK